MDQRVHSYCDIRYEEIGVRWNSFTVDRIFDTIPYFNVNVVKPILDLLSEF